MNGKPNSLQSLFLTVQYVDTKVVPDALDRLILQCLVTHADYPSGRNSHPGNPNIEGATGIRQSSILARIAKLIGKKLIERTKEAHGRSLASVYRICLENPAYPDKSPNGRWLTENTSGLTPEVSSPDAGRETSGPTPEVSLDKLPVEGGNTSGTGEENFRLNNGKLPVGGDKTSGPTPEDTKCHQQTTLPPTKESPKTSGMAGGWKAFEKQEGNIPDALLGTPTGKLLPALEKILAEHGWDVTKKLLMVWVERRPLPVSGIKRNKYMAFLEEYPPLLPLARKATAEGRAQMEAESDAMQKASEELFRKSVLEKDAGADEEVESVEKHREIMKELSK